MADQATSFVQEGVDRFNSARDRIDENVQRVQKELRTRRKRLERQLESSRKSFEKQTRRQVKELRKSLTDNPVVQRASEIGEEAQGTLSSLVERALGLFQIASKGDVEKIDRKLSKISKRLKTIEQARSGNGRATA